MKRKGITIWEQHLERIVLAAAVLFFLGFTAFQAISEPNAQDEIKPSEIDGELSDVADRLAAGLSDNADPTVTLPDYAPVSERFASALKAGVSPQRRLPANRTQLAIGGEATGDAGGEAIRYHVPEFPAPTSIAVQQDFDAIEPEVVSQIEELADRFDQSPYDVTWTTVFAVVSLEEMQEELAAARDGSAVPTHWAEAVDYIDLRLVREELVDGQWMNETEVAPLPGMLSYREQARAELSKREGQDLRLAVQGERESILRPSFYDTVAGNWLPIDPRGVVEEVVIDEADPQSADLVRLRRLERTLRDLRVRKQQLETVAEEENIQLDCEEREKEAPKRPGGEEPGVPGGRRSGGGEGIAPPGAGGGFGAGPGAAGEELARRERMAETLNKQCQALTKRINRSLEDILDLQEKLGLDRAVEEEEIETDLWTAEEIVVWGFDLDVETGSTYRYRVAVDVFNPFHGKMLHLEPDQQHLARDVTLSSTWSEWSDPVEVHPPTRVFVTKAIRDKGDRTVSRAVAEVYRFLGGRWWSERFNIEAGSRLGERRPAPRSAGADAPESIDYGTTWYVLDIQQDLDAPADDRAGVVVLQDATNPGRVIIRDPRRDFYSDDRLRLRQLVDSALVDIEVAAGIGEG